MAYFLISNSDGDTTVSEIDPEKFPNELARGDYGEDPKFFASTPKERDTNYWGDYQLIIKGEVVCPKPKQVVSTYEL